MLTAKSLALLAAFLATTLAQDDAECEVPGYDVGVNSAFFLSSDEGIDTLETCGGLCEVTEECVSFAHGDGQCLLYDVAVDGNVYEVETSPYLFSDLACVDGIAILPEEPEEEQPEEEQPEEEQPEEEQPEEEQPEEEQPEEGGEEGEGGEVEEGGEEGAEDDAEQPEDPEDPEDLLPIDQEDIIQIGPINGGGITIP